MPRFITLVTILLAFNLISGAQDYRVSLEDRNEAIVLVTSAREFMDQNNTGLALQQLLQAITIDSTIRESYLYLYKVCLLRKEFPEALITSLQKAERIFREDDEICYYAGEAYRMRGDMVNAFEEYSRAIAYSKINGQDFPLVPYYYFNRGNCYLKKKLYSEAAQDYSEALKLKPDYSIVYLNRGVCYYMLDEESRACSDWHKALDLHESLANEYIQKYCISP